MVAYVETVREVAKEEAEDFRLESGRKSSRGRPPEPGSSRDIERRTGLDRSTVQMAETHVATADTFPFMQPWPQYRVLEAKEYLGNCQGV
jgi:hypothetical protein